MKSCDVFLVRDIYLVVCMSNTEAGFQVMTQPMYKSSIHDGAEILGNNIFMALDAVQENLPIPTESKSIIKPFLVLSGYRSWKKFASEAVCCSVIQFPNKLRIIPSKSDGKGAYLLDDTSILELFESVTPQQMGKSVERIFRGILEPDGS